MENSHKAVFIVRQTYNTTLDNGQQFCGYFLSEHKKQWFFLQYFINPTEKVRSEHEPMQVVFHGCTVATISDKLSSFPPLQLISPCVKSLNTGARY